MTISSKCNKSQQISQKGMLLIYLVENSEMDGEGLTLIIWVLVKANNKGYSNKNGLHFSQAKKS